jgi:hypothetical protein
MRRGWIFVLLVVAAVLAPANSKAQWKTRWEYERAKGAISCLTNRELSHFRSHNMSYARLWISRTIIWGQSVDMQSAVSDNLPGLSISVVR